MAIIQSMRASLQIILPNNFFFLYQMDPAAALPIDYLLMDSALYEALVEGNEEDVDESLWYKMEQHGGRQVTPKGNTILHIAALYGHLHFVQKILEKHSSLLCVPNKKNETALHIAAREGHSGVVSALINCAKARPELESGIGARDMVRMMDGDKDTALHKAVRKGHLEVVKLLVKEDPEFEFGANEAGETPLYIAAELQFHECLVQILNNSHRPVFNGPLGRTALHAAIIHRGSPKDSTKLLLEKEASLCEVGDNWGWTPLHYAIRLHNEKAVEEILQVKSSAAYIPAGGKEGEWTTAVHIAVSENSVVLFKQILQQCPLCWEMVDSKGRNVLHEAILNDARKVIKFILNSPKMDHLVDEKDEDGDTPLHLVAASNNYVPQLIPHPRLKGTVIFNKQNLTPLDIAYQEPPLVALKPMLIKVGWKRGWRCDLTMKTKRNACNHGGTSRTQMIQKRKDREEMYTNSVAKVAQTHIVVATLIATVTFAAGITLPGGYNNTVGETTQGMAILLGKSAFKAFVITNAIGFVCSIASLTGYIRLVGEASDTKRLEILENVGFYSALMLDLSLIAVVLAFATGMFAVLTHSTALAVGLCISICILVVGLISFPVFIGYKERGLIVSKFKKYVIIKKA
ncbi:PREDICTED: protein ACCELERATED CELL DEATH 6-like [Ipomoea nil]|uniref:protein ACCELERATED CELL DEATH 6-like n=1 Tax=Ipomoea nil TaxID=35883 RepID=UPI000901C1B5|nr:PREDICTED: protein ACCELERATED CELL DEATH 6-like [Ipomoea nil]